MPLNDAAINTLGGQINQFPGGIQSFQGLSSDLVNFQMAERNYKRNRADTLADWDRQNAYNTPAAQMQRFRDAGINPNLVVGSGGPGNSTPVNTPDASAFQTDKSSSRNPPVDLLATQLAQADLKIKAAQANNLNIQSDVIREDFNLRKFQAERAGFDLGIEKQFSADHRREAVRQLRTSTDLSISEDARRASLNSSNLKEGLERMLNMQQQRSNMVLDRSKTYSDIRRNNAETDRARKHIELMDKDGTLRSIEIELRNQGVNPNDPGWQRELMKLYHNIFGSTPGDIFNSNR